MTYLYLTGILFTKSYIVYSVNYAAKYKHDDTSPRLPRYTYIFVYVHLYIYIYIYIYVYGIRFLILS